MAGPARRWPAAAVVMYLLLHFTRLMHVLKSAADRPVGYVGSAVMLNAKLKPGVNLLHVMALTESLGERVSAEGEHAGGLPLDRRFAVERHVRIRERQAGEMDAGAAAGRAGGLVPGARGAAGRLDRKLGSHWFSRAASRSKSASAAALATQFG